MTSSGAGAVPGWYPDPYDARQLRYWDGLAWTESVVPAAAPGQPLGAPTSSPSGLGDIGPWLSETFSVLIGRLGPIALLLYGIPVAGVAAVVVLARSVVAGVSFDTVEDRFEGFDPVQLVPVAVLTVLVLLVVVWCWLAANHQLYASHRGQPCALGDSLAIGAKRLPRAIFWWLVVVLAALLGYAVLLGLPAALAFSVSPAFAALLVVSVVAVIVLAVWLAVKLAFFGPAVAVAPSGVNPLGVSWKLTAGRFWPVLGRLLLLWAILWGISLVGQIAFQAVVTVAMEAAFGFELDPVTGELLIDGQEASELDVIELDSLIPSSPLLVLLVALTALTQSATQAVTVSATTALYARAGGPGELVA